MAYLMIIDDDEDFAASTAQVLREDGHEVRIELDTEDALSRMNERRPALVILDVMFPGKNGAGFDLARKIRNYSEQLEGISILMLTAVNAKSSVQFSAHDIDDVWLPISDFLEKPVDANILRNKVRELLSKTGAGTRTPGKEA